MGKIKWISIIYIFVFAINSLKSLKIKEKETINRGKLGLIDKTNTYKKPYTYMI